MLPTNTYFPGDSAVEPVVSIFSQYWLGAVSGSMLTAGEWPPIAGPRSRAARRPRCAGSTTSAASLIVAAEPCPPRDHEPEPQGHDPPGRPQRVNQGTAAASDLSCHDEGSSSGITNEPDCGPQRPPACGHHLGGTKCGTSGRTVGESIAIEESESRGVCGCMFTEESILSARLERMHGACEQIFLDGSNAHIGSQPTAEQVVESKQAEDVHRAPPTRRR